MYEGIEKKYKSLLDRLKSSYKMEKIYANQKLEKIVSSEELEQLKVMGIYGGEVDVNGVRRMQIQMYMLTSQILLCAEILGREEKILIGVRDLHSNLEKIFKETYVKPDYERVILEFYTGQEEQ